MGKLKTAQLIQIDKIIQAVAEAHSKRCFKPERNVVERSDFVRLLIGAEVALALNDAGYSMQQIFTEIDPEYQILKQMMEDGYIMGESTQPLSD